MHMKRCAKERASNGDACDVSADASQQQPEQESLLTRCQEETSKMYAEPAVICEQVFALHNVKLVHTGGIYAMLCDICRDVVPADDVREHVHSLHCDDKNYDALMEKLKKILRRLRDVDRRRKAASVECQYCHRKLKKLFSTSYDYHLRICPLNPNRNDSLIAPNVDAVDDVKPDATKDESVTAQEETASYVCELCSDDFQTATSLMHHLTKEHKEHSEYQPLWDSANHRRLHKIHKLTTKIKKQAKPKLLRCKACGFKCASGDEMKTHRDGCAASSEKHVCHLCGKEMKSYGTRMFVFFLAELRFVSKRSVYVYLTEISVDEAYSTQCVRFV